jgi:hypothetical protein
MFYAVDISINQLRTLNTETVVEAGSPEEALALALEVFVAKVLDPTSDAKFDVQSAVTTGSPRVVNYNEDLGNLDERDSIPYVYDLDNNTVISLEDEPVDEWNWTISDIDLMRLAEQAGDEPYNEWTSAQTLPYIPPPFNTLNGVPVPFTDSFETRPTKDIPRPLVTKENGYTPLDGEFRNHAVRPYYLGGPAAIEIGTSVYGLNRKQPVVAQADYGTDADDWETDWQD